jgi:hypothetical protein
MPAPRIEGTQSPTKLPASLFAGMPNPNHSDTETETTEKLPEESGNHFYET